MGRPPKYSYPADDVLVQLVERQRSLRRVALDLGIPPENLRVYILKRPKLKERIYALLPERYANNYPSDEEMVALMEEHRNFGGVAKACGVIRESLKDYLRIRPELKARMEQHSVKREWESRSPEERKAIQREQARKWSAKEQKANPERKRENNRRWGKNQSPEKRAKWNNYNRLRRREVTTPLRAEDIPEHLYGDPCSYCGEAGGTVDHIVPIKDDGTNDPENLTAACHSCNCSKNDRPLLHFMLSKRD